MEKYMFYTLLNEKDKQLPIYLVSAGIFPGQTKIVRPGGGICHQIFIVSAGCGTYICDGKSYTLEAGTCFFVPKGMEHEYYGTDETFTTRWVAFDGKNITNLLDTLGLNEVCVFEGGLQSTFDFAQEALLEQTRQNADNTVLSAHTYSALIAFAKLRNSIAGNSNTLERARTFMRTHCTEPLSLEEISATVQMSKYNFCRAFKKCYDISPFTFLLQLRIQRAKLLLTDRHDLSIAQIGEAVGFRDTGYFIKCFKKLEYITPLEFRKTRI